MAMMPDNFDANTTPPTVPFEPVPVNKYLGAIVESENCQTKDGSGQYTKFVFSVLEGEYKGRRLYKNLNLQNKSPQAVAMARGELSAICRAANVMQARDTCELHNIPMVIDVKQRKDKGTGEIQNEIKGFEHKSAWGKQSAPAAVNDSKPWERRS